MMKYTEQDWLSAFGKAPERFAQVVRQTVEKNQRPAKSAQALPLRRVAIIAALGVVLLASVAFALSRFGVLDTIGKGLRDYLQPGAQDMVQTSIVQQGAQPMYADYTVEEAIYDGKQVYATIRVKAHDGDRVLLMDMQAEPSVAMDWWIAYDFESGQTFSNNVHETGRALVYAGIMPKEPADGGAVEFSSTQVHYDGEDIIYTLQFPMQTEDEAQVLLEPITYLVNGENDEKTVHRGELSFEVPLAKQQRRFAANTPVEMPEAGLVLRKLEMVQTPIATYLNIEYRLSEAATDVQTGNFAQSIWANWLDEQGQPYPEGNSMSALESLDEDTMRLSLTYRAFEGMPEDVVLEFYNAMSKERFDTITLSLIEEEPT